MNEIDNRNNEFSKIPWLQLQQKKNRKNMSVSVIRRYIETDVENKC